MTGLGRMHEHGRRPGRRQGGGYLAPDMPAFAHSHHDDTPAHAQHHLHDTGKRTPDVLLQTQHRRGFDVQGFPRQTNCLLRLDGQGWRVLKCHGRILWGSASLASIWG